MKIFITGGTGFVGSALTKVFTANGHTVGILSRPGETRPALPAGAAYMDGDPTREGSWQNAAAGYDVFVNLAGATIFSRWTPERKKAILESRIRTTRNLVDALLRAGKGERTLLSTSAVGFYGFHGDEEISEEEPSGEDFLAGVAAQWEAEALRAQSHGVRVAICRFGIVLGRNGGALGQLVPLFRFRLGSRLGNGRQWFSWVHEDDLARIFLLLIERKDLAGPFNCTAPSPVRNSELTAAMARALGVSVVLPPVPSFMMKLVMGEFADILLKGQRVLPQRLLRAGFSFRFPVIDAALGDLVR